MRRKLALMKARANNAVADKPFAPLWPRIQTSLIRSNAQTALAKVEAISVRAALKEFIELQSAGCQAVCPGPPCQTGLISIFVVRRRRDHRSRRMALAAHDLCVCAIIAAAITMVLIRDRTVVRFFAEHSQAEQQLAAESGSRDQIEAGAADDDKYRYNGADC
jgi:hypothetical protein